MLMGRQSLVVLLWVVSLTFAGIAQAQLIPNRTITTPSGNLLSNGDFETPPYDTVDAGWTVGGTGNVAEATEGSTDGTHAAAFSVGQDSEGTILSQSFTTTPGQSYKVEFDSGVFGIPNSTLQLHVEVTDAASLIDQIITPPVANTFDPSLVIFHHYTFKFVATDTTTTLRFTDIGSGNSVADTLVDSVSATETPPNLLNNGDFETPPFDTVAAGWIVGGTGNAAGGENAAQGPATLGRRHGGEPVAGAGRRIGEAARRSHPRVDDQRLPAEDAARGPGGLDQGGTRQSE
jgi:hypothetical protein